MGEMTQEELLNLKEEKRTKVVKKLLDLKENDTRLEGYYPKLKAEIIADYEKEKAEIDRYLISLGKEKRKTQKVECKTLRCTEQINRKGLVKILHALRRKCREKDCKIESVSATEPAAPNPSTPEKIECNDETDKAVAPHRSDCGKIESNDDSCNHDRNDDSETPVPSHDPPED